MSDNNTSPLGGFREFFKDRNGRDWPKLGESQPYPHTWESLFIETGADYMDRMRQQIFALLEEAKPSFTIVSKLEENGNGRA